MSGFLTLLKNRGLLASQTHEHLDELVPIFEQVAPPEHMKTAYVGFDPTADSLTIGNFIQVLGLKRWQMAGHRPIALVGGGTGLIGDPSGKTQERQLLTKETVEKNVEGIRELLGRLLDFDEKRPNRAYLLNNADWLTKITFVDFLRDVGKYFTVPYMLAKESVKSRLETGISFTEFSYMLLQAYDFKYLFENYNCEFQFGATDQFGNITAGIEFIRKTLEKQAYGFAQPLILDANGVKIGKSQSITIWLSEHKTTVYKFYQYWINTQDADVERFLFYFTFLSENEIKEIIAKHQQNPEQRYGQKILAEEVTDMVHGKSKRTLAENASHILFGGDPTQAKVETFQTLASEIPFVQMDKQLLHEGLKVSDICVSLGITTSKGEAQRAIEQGSIYLKNQRVIDKFMKVTANDLLEGGYLLFRKGTKQYYLAQFI
ncbi:MAG: tyrosine--tRNA ligase [bacterium]|nr:tyrosine--tRNA ligase [bacterium]